MIKIHASVGKHGCADRRAGNPQLCALKYQSKQMHSVTNQRRNQKQRLAHLNAPRQLLVVEFDRSLELAARAVAIAQRLISMSDKSDKLAQIMVDETTILTSLYQKSWQTIADTRAILLGLSWK